jgi:hypothetical protein
MRTGRRRSERNLLQAGNLRSSPGTCPQLFLRPVAQHLVAPPTALVLRAQQFAAFRTAPRLKLLYERTMGAGSHGGILFENGPESSRGRLFIKGLRQDNRSPPACLSRSVVPQEHCKVSRKGGQVHAFGHWLSRMVNRRGRKIYQTPDFAVLQRLAGQPAAENAPNGRPNCYLACGEPVKMIFCACLPPMASTGAGNARAREVEEHQHDRADSLRHR